MHTHTHTTLNIFVFLFQRWSKCEPIFFGTIVFHTNSACRCGCLAPHHEPLILMHGICAFSCRVWPAKAWLPDAQTMCTLRLARCQFHHAYHIGQIQTDATKELSKGTIKRSRRHVWFDVLNLLYKTLKHVVLLDHRTLKGSVAKASKLQPCSNCKRLGSLHP